MVRSHAASGDWCESDLGAMGQRTSQPRSSNAPESICHNDYEDAAIAGASPIEPGFEPGPLLGIPQRGIYENDAPVYVGRSKRMRKRLLEHSRPSSMHNSATFALSAGDGGVPETRSRLSVIAQKSEAGGPDRTKDRTFSVTFAME